jgi:hypothetical protein
VRRFRFGFGPGLCGLFAASLRCSSTRCFMTECGTASTRSTRFVKASYSFATVFICPIVAHSNHTPGGSSGSDGILVCLNPYRLRCSNRVQTAENIPLALCSE